MIPQIIGYALRVAGPYLKNAFELGNAGYSSLEEHNQTSILENLIQEGHQQTILLEGLQTSLGLIISGTTLLSGLSALSLYKINQIGKNINQLRKDVSNLSSQVESGFLDLRNFVQERTDIVIDYHYKASISQAYQHYCKGMQDLQSAIRLGNLKHKDHLLYKSRTHFDQALIIYDSQSLIKSQNSVELLNQLEITTIIESMQGMLWFLLNEPSEAICAFKTIHQKLDIRLKTIGEHVDEKTIDLILIDTQAIRNNDMNILNSYFK